MKDVQTRFLKGENPIGELFERFPELNVRQVAKAMGISEALMRQYVCGTKRPSFGRALEIEDYLHKLGEALLSAHI